MSGRKVLSVLVLLSFLTVACASAGRYEGVKYKVTLDSDPPGATLYLVPRSDWLALNGALSEDALKPWRVVAHGGVAPAEGVVVVDYQQVLVGRWDDGTGEVEFRPTHHGERIVVTPSR